MRPLMIARVFWSFFNQKWWKLNEGVSFSGGTKRESFHGHVFNFKLARFVTNHEKYQDGKQPILELKTWPRVGPVG